MRSPLRSLVLALVPLALVLGGCAKGPQDRLAGRWVGESIDNIPPDQEGRANGWVKGTSFEFRGDRLTVAIPAEEPRTGSYKVERVNGQKLTLQVTRPSGELDETVLTLTGEGSMKWDIGNDRQVKLTRISSAQLARSLTGHPGRGVPRRGNLPGVSVVGPTDERMALSPLRPRHRSGRPPARP